MRASTSIQGIEDEDLRNLINKILKISTAPLFKTDKI